MGAPLRIDVITLFPDMLHGALGHSMISRAVKNGLLDLYTVNPRDFATDVHRTVDARPFGGGPGMLMMCDPIFQAIESVKTPASRILFMTPQGKPFVHERAVQLSRETHLIFLCGHYEGIDQRIRDAWVQEEISIGDYVCTNGVLPAAVVIDALTRHIPGVLGDEESAGSDSFANGLLEYPQYTRPAEYRGRKVPDILLSGNHQAVADWRTEQARQRTKAVRPDLLS